MGDYYSNYGVVLAVLTAGVLLVAVAFGTAWSQTQIRYYVFAFLFVIFDVESVFLFPWALVFDRIGVAAFWEMVVFVGVLAVGLLYAFKKGVLRWA